VLRDYHGKGCGYEEFRGISEGCRSWFCISMVPVINRYHSIRGPVSNSETQNIAAKCANSAHMGVELVDTYNVFLITENFERDKHCAYVRADVHTYH
jgi:hypothetical protein